MTVPLWIIELVVVAAAAGIGVAGTLIYKRYEPSAKERPATAGGKPEDANGESFWFGLAYSAAAALTAVLIPLLLWFGLQAVKHWLPSTDVYTDSLTGASIIVTLVVIAGVIGLLAVLMMTALAFSSVKLADSTQALGLPEGSVRAVIALSLIVIFIIIVVFLFGNLRRQVNQIPHLTFQQANAIPGELVLAKHREDPEYEASKEEAESLKKQATDLAKKGAPEDAVKAAEAKAKKTADDAEAARKTADAAEPATKLYTVDRSVEPTRGSEDFAKQVITTISTLVVSIAAFYFGSTTAISAAKSGAASGAPVITKQPVDLNVKVGDAAKFSVAATGSNLSYQWQKTTPTETKDIPGAMNNSYEIAAVTLEDNGSMFSCKITNPAGTVTSRAAKLTVRP